MKNLYDKYEKYIYIEINDLFINNYIFYFFILNFILLF